MDLAVLALQGAFRWFYLSQNQSLLQAQMVEILEAEMSFSCQQCGKQVGSGVKMTKIVTESRRKFYKEHRSKPVGTEIVKEIGVCPECAIQN